MEHKLKRKKLYILFIYFAFVLLIGGAISRVALASENTSASVIIKNGIEEYDLTNHLVIFQDENRELTINSIFSPEIIDQFKSYKESNLSGQISNSAYWGKIELNNDRDEAVNMVLEISKPQLNNVKLYRFHEGRLLEEIETGSDYIFSKRDIKNRNFVFSLRLPPKASETIIFRVAAKSYLQLPIKLYTDQRFIEKEGHSNLVLGFYYGIMFIMFSYNLILYFSLKDNSYIYYCCFILSFSIMQLIWDGLAFQYLWPNFVSWNIKSNPIFIALSGIFSLLFTRSFLRVGNGSKVFDKLMRGMLFLEIAALIVFLFIPVAVATKISVILITISTIMCFMSIAYVKARDRAVNLYVISWIALFLGSILNILAAYKILPLNFITLYSPRIGAVMNIVLLSLSLGDRFNIIRQEKVIAEKQRVLLESLHNITKTITSTKDIGVMLTFLLQSICKITKFQNGMIVLKEDQDYVVKAVLGYKAEELINRILFNINKDAYFKRILHEDNLVILKNAEMQAYGLDRSFESVMGFPITYNEENVGVIILYSNTTEALNGIENQVIYDFTGQVGIAIQNARLFNQIEEMATVDGLTGAYSRTHFMELCDAAIEEHRSTNRILSLIMLDIDYFKKINDTYGHLAGDKVLKELVSTIKEELNENSIIGRYGGEEFLILLKETDLEKALDLAEKLRVKVEGMQVRISNECCVEITSSIGVVSYNKNFENISQLIEKADEALYISKENGRNQVRAVLTMNY